MSSSLLLLSSLLTIVNKFRNNNNYLTIVMSGGNRAGPRTLECGGGASGPESEQSNTRYDVSGLSRKGGEYERGSPPLI